MPLHEYRCLGCGKGFEVLVRSRSEEVSCPSCQGRSCERQLSSFACGPSASPPGAPPCATGRGGCDGCPCGH